MGNDNASSRINLHARQIFLQERWSKISRPSARKNIKDRPAFLFILSRTFRVLEKKKEREKEKDLFIGRVSNSMIGCSPLPFIYRESAAIGKVNPESNSFVIDHGYFFAK